MWDRRMVEAIARSGRRNPASVEETLQMLLKRVREKKEKLILR